MLTLEMMNILAIFDEQKPSAYLVLLPQQPFWNRKWDCSVTPHGPGKQDQPQKEQAERGERLQRHLAQMELQLHLLASYTLCFLDAGREIFLFSNLLGFYLEEPFAIPPPPNHPFFFLSFFPNSSNDAKAGAQLSLQIVHFVRFNP